MPLLPSTNTNNVAGFRYKYRQQFIIGLTRRANSTRKTLHRLSPSSVRQRDTLNCTSTHFQLMATVLVVGSGCREHVLAWKLSASPKVSKVFVAPGNGGTCTADGKVTSLELNVKDVEQVASWCTANKPTLVVVGPEDPLNNGLSNRLKQINQPCFGPSKAAAQIECDKGFAKNFMKRNGIPTADFVVFGECKEALDFIRNDTKYSGYVVKATGLAAGKGVVVAKDREEACAHVKAVLEDKQFGASDEVVVEELLQGYEVSLFVFSDGTHYSPMIPAQDFKRAYEGDEGPNTGGMGSICPVSVEEEVLKQIEKAIIKPTLEGMKREGRPFVGCLYAGLMVTPRGPKVIEFNCRFGDPETQTVLPLLKSDLFTVLQACVEGKLHEVTVEWYKGKFACGVVLASEKYPATPIVGREISALDQVTRDGLLVFHGGTKQQGDQLLSSGGRVLTVVSVENTLSAAVSKAISGVAKVRLQGSFYRKDIGAKEMAKVSNSELTYKASGVDIDAGEALVDEIKKFAPRTSRPGVMEALGGFGALFDLAKAGYKDPVLVSGTDGVGTKLVIAIEYGKFDTVGIDLVAMCVNDILVQGAEPLYFLDYFACGKLDVSKAAAVVKSIADGCAESGCALVGGETAEMPDMYHGDDFDLAGFAVGAVEKDSLLPWKEQMKEGDVVIGLASNGIHSNGYSLVRKVVARKGLSYNSPAPFDPSVQLGEVLLTPTKLYVKPLLPLVKGKLIKGLAHITGGGLIHNIPRVLPTHLAAHLDASSWSLPPVFKWISQEGPVASEEMLQTFNCGLGMVCIVSPENSARVLKELENSSIVASVVGTLHARKGEAVTVTNFLSERQALQTNTPAKEKKRVAVLISGSGTNLQALIDYVQRNRDAGYELALVVSNVKDVPGLERARIAGIKTQVISHIGKKRVDFDMEVNELLNKERIQLVCLAGFMRILSAEFVRIWSGKLINIHPSLLPLFKGMDTHQQAIESGVRIHGCTVHFVDEGVDTGGIIMQKSVPVLPGDTKEHLQERVKVKAEHIIYPLALDRVAKEMVKWDPERKKVLWVSSSSEE